MRSSAAATGRLPGNPGDLNPLPTRNPRSTSPSATAAKANRAPELLVIQSVNRRDRLVRAKLGWTPVKNWRFTVGVDAFTGPVTGFFGRFGNRDRAYVETRYDF